MSRRVLAIAALLGGCGDDRGIVIVAYRENFFGDVAPPPSRMRVDTMAFVRASEVRFDENDGIADVLAGCIVAESSGAAVQVARRLGNCEQFAIVARAPGTAVVTFSKGDLTRELSIVVDP